MAFIPKLEDPLISKFASDIGNNIKFDLKDNEKNKKDLMSNQKIALFESLFDLKLQADHNVKNWKKSNIVQMPDLQHEIDASLDQDENEFIGRLNGMESKRKTYDREGNSIEDDTLFRSSKNHSQRYSTSMNSINSHDSEQNQETKRPSKLISSFVVRKNKMNVKNKRFSIATKSKTNNQGKLEMSKQINSLNSPIKRMDFKIGNDLEEINEIMESDRSSDFNDSIKLDQSIDINQSPQGKKIQISK